MAAPGEMTRPAATDPSTAKYIRMWCRTNVRPPSHQRLSSHSVPTKRASRAQRNSAPNPDSRFTLEITLGTSSRVSRNTKALARMRSRRLTRERQRERGDQRAHGDHLDEGAGQRDDGLRPGGAERVEDQQPPDDPDDLRCAGGRGSAPGWVPRVRSARQSPRFRSRPSQPPARAAEGAARVLLVRRALPLPEVEHPARVVGDEVPRPEVDVVVPAVVLLAGDRLGHPLALVRRPVRIGAVVGQHRHAAALHRALDDGRVQHEAVVVDVHPLGLPPAVGVERCGGDRRLRAAVGVLHQQRAVTGRGVGRAVAEPVGVLPQGDPGPVVLQHVPVDLDLVRAGSDPWFAAGLGQVDGREREVVAAVGVPAALDPVVPPDRVVPDDRVVAGLVDQRGAVVGLDARCPR